MRALVTGATGFLGRRLVAALDHPVVLGRDPDAARIVEGAGPAYRWVPDFGPPPPQALDGVEAVFHLAGEPVAGRWDPAKKRRILDSRVLGTRHLVQALARMPAGARPRVLVSASAVGYYGSRGDEVLDEGAAPGSGFLAQVCIEWEAAAAAARDLGVRVASPRIGIVLGEGGGALDAMLPLFRLGLGGPLGNGRQWMPWVHVDDVVGTFLHAATCEAVDGAINAVGPAPVPNREFARELGRVLRRPAFLPAPAAAVRLALGEFAEAVLGSQRAVPTVAVRTGYRHRRPGLHEALQAALGGGAR